MRSRHRLYFTLGALALFSIATLILLLFYAEELHVRVLVPIIRAAYTAKHYLDHLHGLVLWLIPLALFSIPLVRALFHVLGQQEPVGHQKLDDWPIVPETGELEALVHQLRHAKRSRFARARISRNLKELSVRLIAGREGVAVSEARQMLENGLWRAHPEIHELLMPRRHYAGRQSERAFEQALDQTLLFLQTYHEEA